MTPQEVASLLKGVAQVKDYFQVDADRVAAWAAILDDDLEFGWAMRHLARLLGESRRTPEPSDFNVAWRQLKVQQREDAHYAAMVGIGARSEPADPAVRDEAIRKCREAIRETARRLPNVE